MRHWWPHPDVDRLVADSKKHHKELLCTVDRLEEFLAVLHEKTEQLEHEPEEEDA